MWMVVEDVNEGVCHCGGGKEWEDVANVQTMGRNPWAWLGAEGGYREGV
jgi:hypothetical protein